VAGSRDPDEIAQQIEATRAELADAIDAIADRMSPKNVAARAAAAVQTPTGRKVAAAGAVLVVAVFWLRRRSR
jgi:Protein of unknown function (DUF3618)